MLLLALSTTPPWSQHDTFDRAWQLSPFPRSSKCKADWTVVWKRIGSLLGGIWNVRRQNQKDMCGENRNAQKMNSVVSAASGVKCH